MIEITNIAGKKEYLPTGNKFCVNCKYVHGLSNGMHIIEYQCTNEEVFKRDMDYVTGREFIISVKCSHINIDGNCQGFEAK